MPLDLLKYIKDPRTGKFNRRMIVLIFIALVIFVGAAFYLERDIEIGPFKSAVPRKPDSIKTQNAVIDDHSTHIEAKGDYVNGDKTIINYDSWQRMRIKHSQVKAIRLIRS